MQSEDLTDSDSDLQMLKLPTSSQRHLPTQPFTPSLQSDEIPNDSSSDLDITNAQTCKFGKVIVEISEGCTGNCSTTSTSPEVPTTSTPLHPPDVGKTSQNSTLHQPVITDHFHKDHKRQQHNCNGDNMFPTSHNAEYEANQQ